MRARDVATVLGVVALLAATISGCSSPEQYPSLDANPAVVDFTTAAKSGAPVEVHMPVNGFLAVTGSGTEYTEDKYWTVNITNPSVVKFYPFDGSGRAARQALLAGLKPGTTTAVITYTGGATPETVTYDVTVGDG